ncbi:MAG: hypothetical protein ACTXOO_05555 [Sodalis sp. (in: enterobacteria)]
MTRHLTTKCYSLNLLLGCTNVLAAVPLLRFAVSTNQGRRFRLGFCEYLDLISASDKAFMPDVKFL